MLFRCEVQSAVPLKVIAPCHMDISVLCVYRRGEFHSFWYMDFCISVEARKPASYSV